MNRKELASKIELVCEVMRRDGLTIMNYIEQLSWLIFLKTLEDIEKNFELEATFNEKKYDSIIEPEYRWSSWAKKDMRAEELRNFIEIKLLPYLQSLHGSKERDLVARLFSEIRQRMRDPFNLKEVITMLDQADFSNPEDTHTLSQIYEEQLMMMGREGGAAGEYYTPRPIVRLMVKIVNPEIGKTVFDPLCGSCGFLVESYNHMKERRKMTAEDQSLLEKSFFGQELKALPYLIGTMNCILHGLLMPNIERRDTFEENVVATPSRRYDFILTNPPFGGSVAKHVRENLPLPTASTELGALEFCMRKLNIGGKSGIVIPEGVLFRSTLAYKKVKEELLKEFNVHTIISLPSGTFA
jgi:type I restriction enzyme M protein